MALTSFPHLSRIEDPAVRETLRLLWDRIAEVRSGLELEAKNILTVSEKVKQVDGLRKIQARLESKASGTRSVSLDPSDPSIPVPGDETPGSPGSPNPPSSPSPGSGDLPNPGSQLATVQSVSGIETSCGDFGWLDAVVAKLRLDSPRWGYNCKRGNCNEISEDVVDYYYGADLSAAQGSTKVYIFDIIGGHCGASPHAIWLDQTRATASAGTIGRWKYPR